MKEIVPHGRDGQKTFDFSPLLGGYYHDDKALKGVAIEMLS